MKKINVILLLNLIVSLVWAQIPTPAPTQSKTIAIVGGTAHIGNGEVIENSVIVFNKGKIELVTTADEFDVERENKLNDSFFADIIDAKGKHIYPGIIALNTQLGLNEINAVRATRDYDEVGAFNPNVRSIIAYSTDSRVTPTIKSNGILLAEITPQGGVISGSASLVQLDAWNWEDAAVKTDHAIYLNWPRLYNQTGWWANKGAIKANKQYDKNVDEIIQFFREAQSYYNNPKPKQKNLKLEATNGLFNGGKQLFVRVNGTREILAAINMKKTFGLKMVIVGGMNSWQVAEHLKENNIPVVLGALHSLPDFPESDIDINYKAPYLLKQAGVEFCLSLHGAWEQRNLMFVAGNAVSYGLSKEEALAAITLSAAKILGIEDRLGTLEKGKDATLIISSGDVLDMRTSNIEKAYISGRNTDLSDKQKVLYQKYKVKYKAGE